MKTTTVVGIIVVVAALLSDAVSAQQFDTAGLQQISRDEVSAFATFWILHPDGYAAPLPFLPSNPPDAPVYILPNGSFLVDETAVEASTMSARLRGMVAQEDSEDPGGDDPPPPPIPNYQKFMGQAFSVIDTNDAAINDIDLYNACTSFPDMGTTGPTLQIALYGTGAVIIKANHFDYSGETVRDFALLVCDNVATPTWKSIDLSGSSDSQDGWLIQGLVSRYDVTDPMYFTVTNMSQSYNCFFQAIPYGGPQIQLTGAEPYDPVASLLTLYASIFDLSGAMGQQLEVSVNGLAPRYSLGPSNSIVIDTHYTPNGVVDVSATAESFNVTLLDPTNAPADAKLEFDNTATLPLAFENQTYVYFPGDMSETNIGVNPIVFGVSPPQYISATLREPSSGRVLASFSGYDPSYSYVELDWNFTEVDGVTAYTNDQYSVTFNASASPGGGGDGTTLAMTNKIERNHVRAANWVISTYEEIKPSSEHGNGGWVNSEMARWGTATEAMYESLYSYDFLSQTLYYTWQIGAGRDNPSSPAMPFILNPSTQAGWPGLVYSVVTNRSYSDFNYGPGHGRAYLIGGGEYRFNWMNYVNTSISANDMQSWVRTGATGPNADTRYKMRKVAIWSCYSARKGVYGTWYNAFGINPSQMSTLSGKNVGLFFNDELKFLPFGTPATDVAEVAAEFDKIWVMGANPYPGGCDPNYAFQFAYNVTLMMFPELANAQPMIVGCPYLPYAGVYDDQLMNNNFSQVRMY